MIKLGAIADDFTGATDLATTLHGRGFRAVVAIEDAPVDETWAQADAVIIALKTRTAPVDAAVAASRAALASLRTLDPEQIYVKYCSTFDSTPDGNIGPVLDAVLDDLGERRTIVVPAFPDNQRTVYRGHLFVGDRLLEDSPMRHHPLTPMTNSRLVDLLAPQTPRPVHEVTAPTVWAGAAALHERLDEIDSGYVVVDATTDADLTAIAEATAHWRVLSGGAGVALGMTGPHLHEDEQFDAPAGRRFVVCGSASATTRAQIADAAPSHPMRKLEVAELAADPQGTVEGVLAWIAALDEASVPVVYSVGSLEDVHRVTDDGTSVSELIESALSTIVRRSVDELGVTQAIIAGGETSGATVRALGVRQLHIGPQLSPGVCWSAATTDTGRDVVLALKSGNFGRIDMFDSAWEVLDARD